MSWFFTDKAYDLFIIRNWFECFRNIVSFACVYELITWSFREEIFKDLWFWFINDYVLQHIFSHTILFCLNIALVLNVEYERVLLKVVKALEILGGFRS